MDACQMKLRETEKPLLFSSFKSSKSSVLPYYPGPANLKSREAHTIEAAAEAKGSFSCFLKNEKRNGV